LSGKHTSYTAQFQIFLVFYWLFYLRLKLGEWRSFLLRIILMPQGKKNELPLRAKEGWLMVYYSTLLSLSSPARLRLFFSSESVYVKPLTRRVYGTESGPLVF
jgi:hypothetical protein